MEQVKSGRTPRAILALQEYFPDCRLPAVLTAATAAAILAIASQASAQELDIGGEAHLRIGKCPTADSATPDDDDALPLPCQERAKAAKKPGTAKPRSDGALEAPFEDPLYPAEFALDCFIENDPDSPTGYELQKFEPTDDYGITDEPVDVTDVKGLTHVLLQAIFQDSRVGVELCKQTDAADDILAGSTDAIRYRLKKPIQPYRKERCRFKRIVPPAASTNPTGPETIEIPLTVTCDKDDDGSPEPCSVDLGDKKPQPENLVCQANNYTDPDTSLPGANVHCWQPTNQGQRVWGGKLNRSDPRIGKEGLWRLRKL